MSKAKDHQLDLLAEQEMRIQAQEAQAANAIWYYSRVMCQIGLPALSYANNEYVRRSGNFHLIVQAPPSFSVPWGIYPRGILNWMVTEVVKKKRLGQESRTLRLGSSLSEFMAKVSKGQGSHDTEIQPFSYSGGKTGNIRPFKKQMVSLLASRIFFWYGTTPAADLQFQSVEIASSGNLMWDPKRLDQPGLIESTVELGEKFYLDCIDHGVPVDIRIIRALWPSCLAFDLYVWLTYRAFTLRADRRWSLDLSWKMLQGQFGHTYKDMRGFRPKFLAALKRVGILYGAMEFKETGQGINFRFKRPSILSAPAPMLPQPREDSTHK